MFSPRSHHFTPAPQCPGFHSWLPKQVLLVPAMLTMSPVATLDCDLKVSGCRRHQRASKAPNR